MDIEASAECSAYHKLVQSVMDIEVVDHPLLYDFDQMRLLIGSPLLEKITTA